MTAIAFELASRNLELPLARAQFSPKHVTSDFYYKIPVRTIWKSYPVYAPGPAGYLEWLKVQEPQKVWPSPLPKTEKGWVKAGELVLDAPIATGSVLPRPETAVPFVADAAWFDKVRPPVTNDGTIPFFRYVISRKGNVEVGVLSGGRGRN